jgi:hypothetical protein
LDSELLFYERLWGIHQPKTMGLHTIGHRPFINFQGLQQAIQDCLQTGYTFVFVRYSALLDVGMLLVKQP